MKKTITAIATALVLAPAFVFAASFTNAEFSGNVTVEGKAGETKSTVVRSVVPAGQTIEYIETDVLGDGLSPVCHNVADLEEGTHMTNLSVKLPPNVGYYDLQVKGFGIFGNFTSNGCDPANQVASDTFNQVLRVLPGSTASNSDPVVGGGNDPWSTILAALNALLAKLDAQDDKPAYCAQLVNQPGQVYGSVQAKQLQMFLIANGFSIPAGATGYHGNQTAAALASAKMSCL